VAGLNYAHEAALRLALSMSTFYYEKMNSVEFAIRHAMGAILRARDAMSVFIKLETTSELDLQNSKEAM